MLPPGVGQTLCHRDSDNLKSQVFNCGVIATRHTLDLVLVSGSLQASDEGKSFNDVSRSPLSTSRSSNLLTILFGL